MLGRHPPFGVSQKAPVASLPWHAVPWNAAAFRAVEFWLLPGTAEEPARVGAAGPKAPWGEQGLFREEHGFLWALAARDHLQQLG